MSLAQLFVSMLLFIVLFFGIGFILNMLLRSTWIMSLIYPIIVIFIVDKAEIRFYDYFINPTTAFPSLFKKMGALQFTDALILSMGLLGAILSGIAIRMLRTRGYRMF
ncbi:hypothetical protein CIB95_15745 [Lottiidibacillus patelloidae]|uniref:Membrane protein YuiB n=1 Tax=Lottiidibacillus patelloidae TaxID=2670334 RepID=A0A263BPR7_9BACI|nr:YuiB family protein [Lottiidibacillus patelloidae]OZM55751.1 hypothetical protein CIB95_15745 [Lottiidibacillus patelloidae]